MIDCNFNFNFEENKLHITPFGDDTTISYKIYDIDTNILIGEQYNIKTNSSYWTSFSILYKEFEFLNGWLIKIYHNDDLILEKEYRINNNKPFCNIKFQTAEDKISSWGWGRLFANIVENEKYDISNILNIDECDTIIDLGSSIGLFTAYVLTKNPNLKIITVEMSESFYNVCHNTFKDFPNVITLNNAVHSESDKSIVYYTNSENSDSLSNSIIKNQYRYVDTTLNGNIEKKVKTISIEDIIKRYELDKVSLIKMDVEGAEYDIIENISDETLSKIERIHLEFHNCNDITRRFNIIDKLCRNGFSFDTLSNNVNIYDNLFTLYFKK